jgi:hypothetical protein
VKEGVKFFALTRVASLLDGESYGAGVVIGISIAGFYLMKNCVKKSQEEDR